jgi:sugar/nucleoside kinase (ribokinase family)
VGGAALALARPALLEIGTARFDYTTVGHVTADVAADGSRHAGGTAFYSALQAARLGGRVLVITRGVEREIEDLLNAYRSEFELTILPAQRTTTLLAKGSGGGDTQRLLAWAGPIGEDVSIDSSILHLAPVARETPAAWRGEADFVGLTAQGLVRSWSESDGAIGHVPLSRAQVPQACDAVVISDAELSSCARLISVAGARPRTVAVTAGSGPTAVHLPNGDVESVRVPAIPCVRDDVGAGDVFAAAFFVALRQGRPPGAAVAFANAAAAVRIAGHGADAIGDRAAIEARLSAVA